MNICFHTESLKDTKDIEEWYFLRSPKSAESFKTELYAAIDELMFMPERWPVLEAELRQITLSQFPYLVYYMILSEDEILITSVKHQRREPDLNRNRE